MAPRTASASLDVDPLEVLPARHRGRGFRLVHGDSLQLLDRLPAGSVDLIFADPPYNLSNGGSTCQSGRRTSVDKGGWDVSRGIDRDFEFHSAWLGACQRVLRRSGTLWVSGTHHAIFSLGFAMQKMGFHILNTITWFKPNASPNLACRFFTHSTEILIWAAPERSKPLAHTFHYPAMKAENGGKQMRDLWPISDDGQGSVWSLTAPTRSEKTEGRHPTQKPLQLLDRIIAAATSPGELVLDPFNGSGTTGLVAVMRDRRYLGIDLDEGYLDLSARRIARASVGAPASR